MEYLRRIMNSLAWRVESLEAHASDYNGSRKRIWDDLYDEEESPLRKRFSNADRRPNSEVEMVSPLFRATEAGDAEAILRLLEDNTYYIPKMNRRGESALHISNLLSCGKSETKMDEVRQQVTSNARRLGQLENRFSEFIQSNTPTEDRPEVVSPERIRNITRAFSTTATSGMMSRREANEKCAASLFLASQNGFAEAILRQVEGDADVHRRNHIGDSALHLAASAGHEQAVVALFGGNTPVDLLGTNGRTPLHCASERGHDKVVLHLLLAGADVNVKDCSGDFPLLLATRNGHLQTVEVLIDNKAALDEVDCHGNSSVVAACKAQYWDILDLLLTRGASADRYRGDDNAPLSIVVADLNYSMLTKILQNTAQKENQMKLALKHCNDAFVIYMFADAVPRFCRSQQARDCMVRFAIHRRLEMIRAMIDIGAEVDGFDSLYGSTSLMYAAWYGRVNVVKMLLFLGAGVNLKNKRDNSTALHYAAHRGHVECVRLLLEAGAVVAVRNDDARSPVDVAQNNEIRELLRAVQNARPPPSSPPAFSM